MKEDGKEEGDSGFDLVPPDERERLVCMIVSRMTGTPYLQLYKRTSYGEVLRMAALATAGQYRKPERT